MNDGYLDLFWALLDTSSFEQIKSTVPENFDWRVLHPKRKTTILVEAVNALSWSPNDQDGLDNLEWLIKQGASCSQPCGRSEYTCKKSFDQPKVTLEVDYKCISFVGYIQAWLDKFDEKNVGESDRKFFQEVLIRIARATVQRQARPRASVDEGIVEIWEKFLLDTVSHNLTIEAADGQVTAHSGMLQAASPVVQAMLASPMKEGQKQQIQLKDTGCSAVTLFLEALYTCSSHRDPDYQTALSALDLAHRWQVEAVVAILADLLQKMITEKSFPAIAEHATLKHLDTLKQACRKFGSECAAIQAKIKKGQFPKVVQDLFQVAEACRAQQVKKRKRL
eukprot:Skav227172  [mRNA]  locus=scaffold1396:33604:34611:+ [translate_table: standard]